VARCSGAPPDLPDPLEPSLGRCGPY
jgi:hypothetical protein